MFLKAEFAEIAAVTVERTRKAKLEAFQKKLAGLKFLAAVDIGEGGKVLVHVRVPVLRLRVQNFEKVNQSAAGITFMSTSRNSESTI